MEVPINAEMLWSVHKNLSPQMTTYVASAGATAAGHWDTLNSFLLCDYFSQMAEPLGFVGHRGQSTDVFTGQDHLCG